MKNRKSIIALLLVAIIGVVGLTIAYFTNTATITNQFQTNSYGTTVEEVFTSPDNWTPGTTTPKTLTVTNSGNVDEAVRISYTETWTSANAQDEGDLALTQNGNRAVLIHFTNDDDWTLSNGYYYYNYKLAPTETTSELLDYVMFNPAITNDSDCQTSNNGNTITCTSTGDGYDGAVYKLIFTIETVQYDKYRDAWGIDFSILSEKPVFEKLAQHIIDNSNVSTVTNYASGETTEAYTFNHSATEQTGALIDYRYIGPNPNNYVYFNCTDDNDISTCEIWRIIGVFSVDDGTGTFENRVKLIRGNIYSSDYWNSNNISEWSVSSLKDYLNNNADGYVISESAQNMIARSKYYLGAFETDVTYTSEDIYNLERSENICDDCYQQDGVERTTSWLGNIALPYASDNYYIYGYGVDNTCFNEPWSCGQLYWNSSLSEPGDATKGWLYNGNIYQNYNSSIWLIDHYLYVYYGYNIYSGNLFPSASMVGYTTSGVRPVLYLKNNTYIVDGNGSSTSPYQIELR